jgi:hypothetical protein
MLPHNSSVPPLKKMRCATTQSRTFVPRRSATNVAVNELSVARESRDGKLVCQLILVAGGKRPTAIQHLLHF